MPAKKIARVDRDNRPTGESREVREGDKLEFLCNGRGRGNHYRVTAKVLKINSKTLKAIELDRSYSPGTQWTISIDTDVTILEYSPEWLALYGDKEFAKDDMVKVDKINLYHGGRTGKVMHRLECGRYRVQFYRQQGDISPSQLTKVN